MNFTSSPTGPIRDHREHSFKQFRVVGTRKPLDLFTFISFTNFENLIPIHF